MTNDEARRNDEIRMTKQNSDTVSSFDICASSFLIHIPLITFLILQFLDVFISLLDAFAALLLDDFSQRSINVFGHPTRIATHEKVRAFGVDPFPNFGGVFRHLMLDVDLLGLVARPCAIQPCEKSFFQVRVELVPVRKIAALMLRAEEEPVFPQCPGG